MAAALPGAGSVEPITRWPVTLAALLVTVDRSEKEGLVGGVVSSEMFLDPAGPTFPARSRSWAQTRLAPSTPVRRSVEVFT